MTIEGQGMPFHKTSYKNGNLFVKFSIKFPESIDQDQIGQIKQILANQAKPQSEIQGLEAVSTKVEMQKFDESQKNTHAQGGTRGNDSEEEDDEEGGGQRVGCQQ